MGEDAGSAPSKKLRGEGEEGMAARCLFQRRRSGVAGRGAGLGRALAEATGGSRFLPGWGQRRRLPLVRAGHLSGQGAFLRLQQ